MERRRPGGWLGGVPPPHEDAGTAPGQPARRRRSVRERHTIAARSSASSAAAADGRSRAAHAYGALAGEGGFEPPDVGSKDRCLTTWRLPSTMEGHMLSERA